jgi:hypothetical protein
MSGQILPQFHLYPGAGNRAARLLRAFALAFSSAVLLCSAARTAWSSAAESADLALVLAVDVSNSVTPERYRLQMDGIARAFEDHEVQNAILSGPHQAIFVTLVEWSNEPHVSIPWTLVTSVPSAQGFAAKVRSAARSGHDFTCMSRALELIDGKILPLLPAAAERIAVDVSGDGHDNCNPEIPTDRIRDRLVAEGVTINGLPILEGEEADTLEQWYRDHVIGGSAAFLVPAQGFADFERAMRQKFIVEISGIVPEPENARRQSSARESEFVALAAQIRHPHDGTTR